MRLNDECVAEFALANANILEKTSSGFNVKRPFELGRRFFFLYISGSYQKCDKTDSSMIVSNLFNLVNFDGTQSGMITSSTPASDQSRF